MKTLYLLRHAKSSWDDPSLADFERPLNDRGRSTAPFMGELMKEQGFAPEIVISSPAKRAKETTKLVTAAAALDVEIVFEPDIYEANPNDLRSVASAIDNKYASAMFVGHNPGMEGFLYYLTGELQPMPTAALAVMELEIDNWNNIGANCARKAHVIRPKAEMREL